MNNFLWQMNFKEALEFCIREVSQKQSHSQSLPSPSLPGNKGKHWVGGCQETKENIGLVVVLPRTYPLPVTNTCSHCCQLQSLSSCWQVQSCQETKENRGLVVVLPRTYPLPVGNSLTLSHCCQFQSLSSCCQVQSCQETKKNIGLVVITMQVPRWHIAMHKVCSCTFMGMLQQKANPLPPHCFAPAGQPRSL